ncbi:MAG: DUF1638 domain-containing protein [Puniceicoccaceae bacterium]
MMSLDPSNCAVLACDVFADELAALTHDKPAWAAIEYLEMGLHDRPDELRAEVQKAIGRLQDVAGVQHILLFYGNCGNGLTGVKADRCELVIPRAHDCISILLGSPEKHQAILKENPGTYFYSPGWVRGRRVPGPDREAHLREMYAERYADDEEMIEDLIEADQYSFAHHNCAAYVDITGNKEAEDYCRKCADSLGWTYKRLQGDDRVLKELIDGDWNNGRFLVVKPGQLIAGTADGSLLKAEAY